MNAMVIDIKAYLLTPKAGSNSIIGLVFCCVFFFLTQYQALSAGIFFFRCTVCNNKDKFQEEMLRMGIHIPEK